MVAHFGIQSRPKETLERTTVPAVCLIAGKELADLTEIIPGPLAAFAFLDRVIKSGRAKRPTACSVIYAVNETRPSGKELAKLDEVAAGKLQASVPVRLIVVAGPVGCGKTTLITSLYELFQWSKASDYSFPGSNTLPGGSVVSGSTFASLDSPALG